MKQLYIKSFALCSPEAPQLAQFKLTASAVNPKLIPAAIRRRTSMTTRMAITAATQAVQEAAVDSQQLPSIFTSLGGEIQVTDALCRLLPDPEELLSPTQFHNSVHNTSAAYWAMLHKCQAPSTAIAAADDSFAMGLIEVFAQLQQQGRGERLLVCYDELWPDYLAPPIGQTALACAFVISTTATQAIASFTVPEMNCDQQLECSAEWVDFAEKAPAAAVIPFVMAIQNQHNMTVPLNINTPVWSSKVAML